MSSVASLLVGGHGPVNPKARHKSPENGAYARFHEEQKGEPEDSVGSVGRQLEKGIATTHSERRKAAKVKIYNRIALGALVLSSLGVAYEKSETVRNFTHSFLEYFLSQDGESERINPNDVPLSPLEKSASIDMKPTYTIAGLNKGPTLLERINHQYENRL